MVLGYLIATGIETGLELGFWTIRKLVNGIYTMTYSNQQDEKPELEELQQQQQEQLKALRDEIGELKELIKLSNKSIKKTE